MNLETFESEIDPVIVSRGRSYYQQDRVSELVEIAPDLYHATADGSALYEVDIRMKGERVLSTACSCPYDRGKYCKHVVAALMKLRSQRALAPASGDGTAASRFDSALPHDTYDAVLSYLEGKQNNKQDDKPARSKTRRATRNQKPLPIETAAEIIEDAIDKFQEKWDDGWSDGNGGYSYMDNGTAMQGADKVADNIERCTDPTQACLLAIMSLAYVIEFVSRWDDSDGIAYSTMNWLETLLEERCAELAQSGKPHAKGLVIDALVAASTNPAYEGWGSQVRFLQHAATLADNPQAARFVAEAISSYEASSRYGADELVGACHRMLLLCNKKAAQVYEQENALHPHFFTAHIEELFLQHDMTACRTLLEERTGWSAHPPSLKEDRQTKQKRSIDHSRPALPNDIFPNGYYTFLEAVLEEQQDREGLLALYRHYLKSWHSEPETLAKIKQVAGQDWEGERDRIIEDAIRTGRHSSIAEDLIREYSLADAALRYCKAEPTYNRGIVRRGGERILHFYRLVGQAYPDEARAMLEDLIEAKANGVLGNDMYREICNVIQCYMSLFGADDARRITQSLRERFARRRNLMKELDALEDSWG